MPVDRAWLRVCEWGPRSGPTVVLIPGQGRTVAAWAPLAVTLASRWHVVSYDRRRHGVSPRRAADEADPATEVSDLRHLIDHFGLDQLVLVAGGPEPLPAVRYALAFPDRVRGLAVLDPAPPPAGGLLARALAACRCPRFFWAAATPARWRPTDARRLEHSLDRLMAPAPR